jgi:NhaA family Na+:H+ antiporter
MRWTDVAALAPLTGVGFTVALLVGELAFGTGNAADDDAKVGVLCGSLAAAILGGVLLYLRASNHRTRKAARTDTGTDHRAATPSDGSPP